MGDVVGDRGVVGGLCGSLMWENFGGRLVWEANMGDFYERLVWEATMRG